MADRAPTFWRELVPVPPRPDTPEPAIMMGECYCTGPEIAGRPECRCEIAAAGLMVVIVEDQPWRTPPAQPWPTPTKRKP